MQKRELFLKAMQGEFYRWKKWVIGAFAVTQTVSRSKPLPYMPVVDEQTKAWVFWNPESNVFERITDAEAGKPVYAFRERVKLKAGDVPNLKEDLESTYGNILVNYIVLVWPFGDLIPYMNGRITAPLVEKQIEPLLETDPAPGAQPVPGRIYVSQFKKYAQAMGTLAGYTQLCVPAATAKSMTRDPRIPEVRQKLIEENKGHLHEPATIAKIDGELVKIDREWIKGDPSERFYITDKSYEVTRKKAHLMHGGEAGLGDGSTLELVQNSLSEGWDISKLPAMANSLRSGSYDRGAMTALGGEAVKFFYRIFQNASIVEKDCGSKLGIRHRITESNYKKFAGHWRLDKGKVELMTEETMKPLVGQVVEFRSPATCKTPYTDFCEVCMGTTNSRYKNGLGAAGANVGDTFMNMFMKSMHGKALKTAHFDFRKSIT